MRAAWRYEHLCVSMALATAFHHSAPRRKWEEAANAAARVQTGTSAARPGIPSEPAPQGCSQMCLPKSTLLAGSNEKNWRVRLCVQELYHPRDFLCFLAAILGFRNKTGLTVLTRGLRFYLVLDFWLAWSTGLPVLSVQHVNLTQMLDRNLSHSGLPVLQSHCRLTQLWLVK